MNQHSRQQALRAYCPKTYTLCCHQSSDDWLILHLKGRWKGGLVTKGILLSLFHSLNFGISVSYFSPFFLVQKVCVPIWPQKDNISSTFVQIYVPCFEFELWTLSSLLKVHIHFPTIEGTQKIYFCQKQKLKLFQFRVLQYFFQFQYCLIGY